MVYNYRGRNVSKIQKGDCMDAYTYLEVLRCLDDKESADFNSLAKESGYKFQRSVGNVDLYSGEIPYGISKTVEDWLQDNGVPFKRFTSMYEDFPPEIVAFDGVRRHTMPADNEGNALVDMRALRGIIDMLEDGEDIRVIAYANSHWSETDVSKMFRWGMEDTHRIQTGGEQTIDTEIIDEEKGE